MKENEFNLISSITRNVNQILSLSQSKFNPPNETIKNCFKVLVLDDTTKNLLASLIKQNTIKANNITLILNIKEIKQNIENVMAIYIITPSKENFSYLLRDIKNKTYDNYSINFNDKLDDSFNDVITHIAQLDSIDRIYNITSYAMNIVTYHRNVFSLDYPKTYFLLNSPTTKDEESEIFIDKIANGLFDMMYTLKCSPIVSYRKGTFVDDIVKKIQNKFNYTFSKFPETKNDFRFDLENKNLLVILNRDEDVPIMLHHACGLSAMINDMVGVDFEGDKNFVVDPVNDFIWSKNITKPFYEVGNMTLTEYKKYNNEIAVLSKITSVGNNNTNLDELSKESEILSESIENVGEQKMKGDILRKQAEIYAKTNEMQGKKHIGEIFEAESMILSKRKATKEINAKVEEIKNLVSKENLDDIFRMLLIYYLVGGIDEEYIKSYLGPHYSNRMEDALRFFKTKRAKSENPQNVSGNIAGKFLKKGFQYLLNSYHNLMTIEQPSMITEVVNGLLVGKETDTFNTITMNEKYFDKVNNNIFQIPIQHVFVFVIGGGSFGEFEYLNEYLGKNHIKVIYGADKIYRPIHFLSEAEALGKLMK